MTETVRTHILVMVSASGLQSPLYWLECRGCGTRWPYDADRAPLEQQPCQPPRDRANV